MVRAGDSGPASRSPLRDGTPRLML